MPNTEMIDTVVDPGVKKQIEDLKKGLSELDDQFIQTAEHATALNNTILNTKSYKDYTKAVNDSAVANEKLLQAQNKTAQSTVDLQRKTLAYTQQQQKAEQQQQKAADAAKKALSPYQQLSKELDKQRAIAKDLGVTYGEMSPQFRQAAKGVQELDAQIKTIDYSLGQSQRNVGNYGNAFREVINAYIPFGDSTLRVSENLKTLGKDILGTETEIAGMGAGFAEFTTASFVLAIASAAYYLSEFKSTGNTVSKFISGLKSQFADLGESVVDNIKNFKPSSFFNLIPIVGITRGIVALNDKGKEAGKGFANSFKAGVDEEADKITLDNLTEISQNTVAANNAQIESLRALAADKNTDITKRHQYIKDAQDLAKQNLKNEQDNAQETINLAIRTGDRFGKLSFDQAQQLSKGDLQLAQELAENGQQFTSKGYELYKQGIEKKIQAQQSSAALALQLQADADNQQLKADRSLAQAQERLDKARVQSALDKAKQVLDSDTAGYDQKIKANKDFVDNSIKLLNIQKKHELDAAGIPSKAGADSRTEAKNRAAIEVETQNAIQKVQNESAANIRKIIKDNNALYAKDAEERLKLQIGIEKQLEDDFINDQNKRLQDIEFFKSQQTAVIVDQYSKGKISEQAYNQQLYDIDAQASADRIQLQVDTLKKIIAAQASALALGFGDPKEIQATGDKLNALLVQQDNLKTQKLIKNGQQLAARRKEDREAEKQLAEGTATFIQTLVDASFENQLNHIKDLETATQDRANSEKAAVNGSIQSQADKTRKINLIDAQAAQQKAKLEAQAKQVQQKQAQYDRLFAEAKIIQNTAIGVTSALAEYPPNIPLAILVGALGAVQLATMLATPLPKFKDGGTTAGGRIVWGEAGIEMATEPSGKISFSPPMATVGNFPAGTKITPNYELTKFARPEKLAYRVSIASERKLDTLIAETRANRPMPQKAPRANGWMREAAMGDSFARYAQKYFR